MTESELAIAALNEEARRRGTSYGKLLVRLTEEEKRRIIREYRPRKRK